MHEILDRIGTNDYIPILAIVSVFGTILIVSLASIISRAVYKIRSDATAAQLKQDMLDRGMSAEEIKTVLEAGRPNSRRFG
jgi:hypothetical protein